MTKGLRGLPRNVWVVTATSLLTDVSSEMLVHLLPLFLANVLGVPIDARKIANYDFSKSYGDGQVTTSGPIPVIAAFSAHLQAVCCSGDTSSDTCDHSFSRGYAANARQRQQGEFIPEIEAYDTGASLPESYRSNLSADHLRSMYTFAQIDNQYENSQRKVVCPVARNATNPNEVK